MAQKQNSGTSVPYAKRVNEFLREQAKALAEGLAEGLVCNTASVHNIDPLTAKALLQLHGILENYRDALTRSAARAPALVPKDDAPATNVGENP